MNQKYNQILRQFFHTETITEYTLDPISLACEYFSHPHQAFKSIHIAGTNGKWSVSKMIFQILKESGKNVWVYTSPHNLDIRERFETHRWQMTEDEFVYYAEKVIAYGRWLSYYEKCVLLAFLYFRDRGCEYVVIEVGMWWRLDATNIITPILSIITSISYDHTEFLGDTLEQIAWEKWGIIKPAVPVILFGKNNTLESIAYQKGSRVISPKKRNIATNLLGIHQISNAQIAYEVGKFLGISNKVIEHALLHVEHHGRLEYIQPNLLVDGAHNEDGMKKLKAYLSEIENNWDEIIYCFNLKKGKNASLVIDVFPEIHTWYVIDSSGFRVNDGMSMKNQVELSGKTAHNVTPFEIFEQASMYPRILFVIFGSLYMLGDFLVNT